jgi:TetR/AcrR family transcriptional regulator, mexJK operon transcriptional repressor
MTEQVVNTADKILSVAIDLMSEKGFKAVSTKEIAKAASVSEMTVFRTFGTKKNILDEAVNKFSYSYPLTKLFQEQIKWDLAHDLYVISKAYYELMTRNEKVFLIALMERNTLPEMHEKLIHHPIKLKEMYVEYFKTMQQQGKVIKGNHEAQALLVMNVNFGRFVSDIISGGAVKQLPFDDFITSTVDILARGLTSK